MQEKQYIRNSRTGGPDLERLLRESVAAGLLAEIYYNDHAPLYGYGINDVLIVKDFRVVAEQFD